MASSASKASTCPRRKPSRLPDGFAAQRVIGTWIDFYNTTRPHSALGGVTPAEAYENGGLLNGTDQPHGLTRSSIGSTTSGRRDTQDSSGMINYGIHLISVAILSYGCRDGHTAAQQGQSWRKHD